MINVLDKGYVKLKDKMGTELNVINAARVSYDKESDELDDRDIKLLKYLINHGHTSPFRHITMTFEVYAPLFVARQWWKHAIGSSYETLTGWNESSRRYVTEDEEFYIPSRKEWRSKPVNSKQGSGEVVDSTRGTAYTRSLIDYVKSGEELYNSAMRNGVAPEQARLFLPAYGMYVRYVWTTSLQAVLHFLDLRLDNDSQYEMQLYARAVAEIVEKEYPIIYKMWNKSDN